MRVGIDLEWHGGILVDGDEDKAEPNYYLVDADTGAELGYFTSYVALESHIAQHHPGCQRAAPALPPPTPKEVALLERFLETMEGSPQLLNSPYQRNLLLGHLYQYPHPPETVARLRKALGLPPG
jgi:hypothetical protein